MLLAVWSRLSVGLIFLFLAPAHAATSSQEQTDIYQIPYAAAVQNRTYPFSHNGLTLQFGYLPVDALNKGITAGLAYSYSLSEFTTWEIFNFNNSFNSETELNAQLQALGFTLKKPDSPEFLDYVNWYVTTGLAYTPFYNKSLLFNKSIVHSETTFIVDAGTVKLERAGYRPLFGGGLYMRYFLGPKTSLKFDFREHIYFNNSGATGVLSLILGFAYQFGGTTSDAQ